MFTGIIEAKGTIQKTVKNNGNITFSISSDLGPTLKPDESVSHNGICLTIENLFNDRHEVTTISETLRKTNAEFWKEGDIINLERAMRLNDRLDGHIVQGHVDTIALCTAKEEMSGSIELSFSYDEQFNNLIIEKGSICVNGVSLTAFNVTNNCFTVAIIPYTLAHTNFSAFDVGQTVNIEFDILGKYVQKMLRVK
ncbi:MAG: riboflavin synthase [Ginsengibacter sp.]